MITYRHLIFKLDDILIYCKSPDEYDMHLKCVMDVLKHEEYFDKLQFLNYFGPSLWAKLRAKLISSTLYSHFDIMYSFNQVTSFNLISLYVVESRILRENTRINHYAFSH